MTTETDVTAYARVVVCNYDRCTNWHKNEISVLIHSIILTIFLYKNGYSGRYASKKIISNELNSENNSFFSVDFNPPTNSTCINTSRKSKLRKCCLCCYKTYANKYTLKSHNARFHNKEKTFKRYKCEICDKEYGQIANYQEHMIVHFPDDINFHCPHCGKEFFNKSKYNTHIKTHEKTWSCNECNKLLKSKHTLKNHMLRHVDPIPEIPCDQCNLRYRTKERLKNHQRDKHQKQ